MDTLPFPLAGRVLVTGPTRAGKSRLTSDALGAWHEAHGPDGLVILDLAPEFRRADHVVGLPLTAFAPVPPGAWHRRLHAHAPRIQARDASQALELARHNAQRAAALLADAPPDPRAVVVNDVTIAYQDPGSRLDALLAYAAPARFVLANGLDSAEFGRDDAISRRERHVLAALQEWADVHVRLPGASPT